MNYAGIKYCDIANGLGCRTVLFVSGCRNACKGCFQPQTWDFTYGECFDEQVQQKVLDSLKPEYIEGMTLLAFKNFHADDSDINKDTVDFTPNFDETEKEPTVLPARYPNLLVNGTTGIAVGMATNIPPHNLRDVIHAVVKLIDNDIEEKETDIDELINIIKGPDFPTGGVILGTAGINEAYQQYVTERST